MNEKNKVASLRKRLVKKSIFKYSNKALFERREKNYNSELNTKIKTKKLYNKTTKFFQKKNNETKEESLLPFYKTMSSFYQTEKSYNIASLLDYFQKKFMYKKKLKSPNKKNIICRTDRNCRDKNLFMTEISTLLSKNIKKMKKTEDSFRLKAKENKKEPNIDVLLLIQSERNQDETNINNNDNMRIDNYLNKGKSYYKNYSYTAITEQNKNLIDKTSTEYLNYVFNIKMSKYEKNQSHKDYISKLNEQKVYLHITKAKTERAKRLEEAHKNQIEFYKDSINSFKKSKKLLENDFTNKIGDYARFISSEKEREKIKQSSLRQKIVDYKKDIEHIKAKINKIEIEKKNIIKWIFLQIQMKEKKLQLPEYYKTIITQFESKKQSSTRLFIKHEERSDSFSEKRKTNKNTFIKSKDHNIINNSKIFNTNGNNEKFVKPEEYKRILNYKKNLIYKTAEEFKDRLISLEKGNLLLLQYKDMLHSQVFKYKKELENIIKNINIFSEEKKKIIEWEREINIIKYIADENQKIVSILKSKKANNLKSNINNNLDKNKQKKLKNNFLKNDTDKYKYKNISLYKSIYIIYEQCLKVENKSIFTDEIINLVNRKINTKEKEMLLMLEFIELTADYLKMSINKKMQQNNEIKAFIKKIKADIENKHKIDKAKLQVLLDFQKIKTLEKNVSKRINKIYFLPKRKISLTEFRNKKVEKIIEKEINKENKIEDFLYNEESSKEV